MKISKICKRYFTFMVLKLQKLPVRKISKRVFSAIQSKPVHVTAVLSLFLVAAGIIFLRSNLQNVFSATYGWVQSDWSGGASATTIGHPTNQTGWSYFSTSTNVLTTGTTTVTLASSTYSSTDDGTFSSTGSGTGGGFSNGVTSSAVVSGSGSSAIIKLSGSTTAVNRVTVTSTLTGAAFHGAAQMVGASGSDYIYAIEGANDTSPLRRYSISGNSWTNLANYTISYFGAQLLWNGSDNYIYLARGQNSTGFDRYSISGNSWSAMTSIPAALPNGLGQTAALRYGTEDYIYLFRGNGYTDFYRYSISGNSWTSLSSTPVALDVGLQAVRDADGDYIYLVTGNGTNFYRYSISGNSWTALTGLPGSITGANASALHDEGSDYIYVLSNNSLYRYSISGNSWTTLADASAVNPSYGTTLIHSAGEDTIYVTGEWQCCAAVVVWGYSISGNSWTSYYTVNGNFGGYGSPNKTAYRRPGDESFYFLTANANDKLFKYTVSQTVYSSSGSFTSASMDLGVARMNSLSWASTTPSGVGSDSIKFQLAANNDNSTWSYIGPDGTSGTYFTTNGTTVFPSSLQGNLRYWRYKVFLSTADTTVSPTLDSVTFSYSSYTSSGTLISSIYDAADPTNVVASVAWNPASLPTGTTIKFQLRSGSTTSSVASATWIGPDGTNSTYFTTYTGETSSSTMRDGSGDRYFQYKAFLDTTNSAFTPTLSSVTVTYVVNANPEVQNVNASQNADGTVTITYQVRDSDTDTGTTNPGYVSSTFEYLDAYGAYQTISVGQLSAGAMANVPVVTSSWTTTTVTWNVPAGLSVAASRIRVTVNDNEAANNTASAISSSTFQIDSVAPTSGVITIDGSQTPALISLSATDSSTLYMKVSQNSSLSDVSSWSDFAATTTVTLSANPATVYVQFKDIYGNTSTIYSATTPETPSSTIVQDISNVLNSITDYRLFVAWKVVAAPSPGFADYVVYRSTDQVSWTSIATNTSIGNNYIADSNITADILYYYKVKTIDSSGNHSIFSAVVNGRANGTQDAGEGGGGTAQASDPVISAVATSSPTPSSITITWNTDILSNSIVGFSTTAGNFTDNVVTVNSMVDNPSGFIGQHSVVLGGLTPNTTYYFRVRSVSANNTSSTDSNGADGYVFTTPSGPTITGVSAVEVYNTFARVIWNTSENADSHVVFSTTTNFASSVTTSSADFGTFHDLILTGLTQGTRYYFYVESVSVGGVTSTDKNLVDGTPQYFNLATTIDTTAPTISSVATSTSDTSANITWVTNENANSQIVYGPTTDYGNTTTLDSTFTTQHLEVLSGLSSSTLYHFKILSTDKNSNTATSPDYTFTTLGTADTASPSISNVATSSVSLTAATITWDTNEIASTLVEYGTTTSSYNSIAGSASALETSHSVSLSGLNGNTTYYFRVRSADASGNSATNDNGGNGWSFTTVADTTAPTVSNISSLVNNTSAIVTWNTNESATSRVDFDLSSSTYSNSSSSLSYETTHTITLNGLTNNTTYYFRVRSVDASGNETIDNNSGSGHSFTTLDTPGTPIIVVSGGGSARNSLDTAPPIISNIDFKDVTPSSALITWDTNEAGNSLVRFGSTLDYGLLTGNDLELLTSNHTVKLINLAPSHKYHFKAVTYDASGNRAESEDRIFTTLNVDGTEAKPEEVVQEVETEAVTESQTISNALQKASSKSLEKFLKDIASNPLLKDIPEDKFIQALLEMTSKVIEPPTIVGIKPTVDVKGTTAIIKWSTDKKSSSEVNYARESEYKAGDSSPYTNAAINPDEFSLNHTIELTNLNPAVTYHFKVVSKGLIGPVATSADYTFQTTGELPVISDIRVTRPDDSPSSVVVTWKTNVSTDSTVEYKSLKTGQSLTQGDSALLINHQVTLKGLEGGAGYNLVIRGKDEFKNEAVSLPITFSTKLDQVSPVISKLSSESTLYPGKDSKVQTIISWETDEPATSQVFYQEGLSGDNIVSLPIDDGLNSRHIVVVTKFKPGTVYKYWVESRDLAGNIGKSEIFSILTPQEKETIIDIIINNFQSVFGWTKNIGI